MSRVKNEGKVRFPAAVLAPGSVNELVVPVYDCMGAAIVPLDVDLAKRQRGAVISCLHEWVVAVLNQFVLA